MKKITLTLLAISVAVLMLTSVYASSIPPCVPCDTPGRTPGFWKHNIGVHLSLRNGKFSSPWEGFDKTLWPAWLEYMETKVPVTLEQAYEALNTGGGGAIAEYRHTIADFFNAAAGLPTLYD